MGPSFTRSFPCLQGNVDTVLVTYEGETLLPTVRCHPKMKIDLQAPAADHWNIILDRVLPMTMEAFWQQRESKAHDGVPHPEEAARGAPGGAHDGGTAPSREQVLKTTHDVLSWVHALCLQSMHELGSMREVDWVLAQTLMAEFTQLQLIVNEDLMKSLLALRADLEASSATLILDIA